MEIQLKKSKLQWQSNYLFFGPNTKKFYKINVVKSKNHDGIIAKILADVVKLLLDTSISGEDSKIHKKER